MTIPLPEAIGLIAPSIMDPCQHHGCKNRSTARCSFSNDRQEHHMSLCEAHMRRLPWVWPNVYIEAPSMWRTPAYHYFTIYRGDQHPDEINREFLLASQPCVVRMIIDDNYPYFAPGTFIWKSEAPLGRHTQ